MLPSFQSMHFELSSPNSELLRKPDAALTPADLKLSKHASLLLEDLLGSGRIVSIHDIDVNHSGMLKDVIIHRTPGNEDRIVMQVTNHMQAAKQGEVRPPANELRTKALYVIKKDAAGMELTAAVSCFEQNGSAGSYQSDLGQKKFSVRWVEALIESCFEKNLNSPRNRAG